MSSTTSAPRAAPPRPGRAQGRRAAAHRVERVRDPARAAQGDGARRCGASRPRPRRRCGRGWRARSSAGSSSTARWWSARRSSISPARRAGWWSRSSGDANAEVVAIQDKKLADVGIRVLRFTDEQVLGDGEPVVAAILEELKKPFDRRAERAANAAGRPREAAKRRSRPGRGRRACSSPTPTRGRVMIADADALRMTSNES